MIFQSQSLQQKKKKKVHIAALLRILKNKVMNAAYFQGSLAYRASNRMYTKVYLACLKY